MTSYEESRLQLPNGSCLETTTQTVGTSLEPAVSDSKCKFQIRF